MRHRCLGQEMACSFQSWKNLTGLLEQPNDTGANVKMMGLFLKKIIIRYWG